uniref:DYW domain-containing protein n=1 Tax=Oryza punctata TaxID=4537 RepID=A0A0E0JCZ7_ORYPU
MHLSKTTVTVVANVAAAALPRAATPLDARMVKTGFDVLTYRLNLGLRSLVSSGHLHRARAMFDQMPHKNIFSLNLILSAYSRSGDLPAAQNLFLSSPHRNATTWTIMMSAHAAAGRTSDALSLFRGMLGEGVIPDHVTVTTVLNLPGCSVPSLHPFAIKFGLDTNIFVCNTLLDAYCKHGLLAAGRRVFLEMPDKDTVTYNAMMMGCSKEGLHTEALQLFAAMRSAGIPATHFTFSSILTAAAGMAHLLLGHQVHALVLRSTSVLNVFVNNSLLDFYSKCDCLGDMRRLFDEMPERDNVSYNMIIAGYAWSQCAATVLRLFREMQKLGFDRQVLPYASMLSLAGSLPDVHIGKQIHAQLVLLGLASEDLLGNALIDMYSKCGMLDAAKSNFSNKSEKSAISWTAMITGYVQNGQHEEALQLFSGMRRAGLRPDRATFSSIIKASSSLAMIGLGRQLHSHLIRSGYKSSVFSGSVLVDMYAKCGCLDEALRTFDEMPERNSISWNAVISAYAHYGEAKNAITMFEGMLHCGFNPDSVTFLSVLAACSHNGLADECMKYFHLMKHHYSISPWKEHYSCVIDTLGRVGCFSQVQKMLVQMPFKADPIIWTSILHSCRIHGNQELARVAADKLFSMEPTDATPYVILSNIYARAGQWEDAARVKKMMRDRGVRKESGYSWVEIKQKIYSFSSNDLTSPMIDEIKDELERLYKEMDKQGYKPNTTCALHMVDHELKLESLKYHSERLAIAFALINTPPGTPIRIMKNLTACVDCHAVIKMISKIVNRDIIHRERSMQMQMQMQQATTILSSSSRPWTPWRHPVPVVASSPSRAKNKKHALRLRAASSELPDLSAIQRVVLDIEGTTTPISFVADVLFPYARDNVRRHLGATYGSSEETRADVALLRAQVEEDLAQGVDGAVAIPPDAEGSVAVVEALAANVESMIRADRKVTALKQLQGRIWRRGFDSGELRSEVYDDAAEALRRWCAKAYIYSSGSREAQRLIFANTAAHGDLRDHLCGFFDTTIGAKREVSSYYEIWQTLGTDRPSQILFLTDVYQEATAAKTAGLEVLISVRPGNAPLPDNHGFHTITSFAEISI